MERRVILNTSSVNRYGYRVLTAGINIKPYLGNPILYWIHDLKKFPIGKIKDLKIDGDVLSGIPVFDCITEESRIVKAQWEAFTLNACSIGFLPLKENADPSQILKGQKYATVEESELLETSIVGVPANSEALALDFNFSKQPSLLPIHNQKSDEMDFKKIALILGLADTATEEQILQKIGELQNGENDAILQLGIEKGVVNDANKSIYTDAIAANSAQVKTYFLSIASAVATENVAPATPAAVTPNPTTPAAPTVRTLAQQVAQVRTLDAPPATTNERASWDYGKWKAEDAAGLRQLQLSKPSEYDKLVSAWVTT
jgi:hypothetical protein